MGKYTPNIEGQYGDPCPYCKEPLYPLEPAVQCDNDTINQGEGHWLHLSCLEENHFFEGNYRVPMNSKFCSSLELLTDFSFQCNKCSSKSSPLPFQLVEQQIMTQTYLEKFGCISTYPIGVKFSALFVRLSALLTDTTAFVLLTGATISTGLLFPAG